MTYCVKTDLEKRFGATEILQLLDRNRDNSADSGVFDAAAEDADALINGYLQGRYTLPLATVPDLVVAIACDVTRYNLWGTRAPDEVRKRYEDAVAKLKDVAKGLIKLALDDGTAAETASDSSGFAYEETERVFTASTLSGFVGS